LEQYQNTKTAFDVAKANLDVAKFNLTHSKIIAQSNGTIYRKTVEENELVGPGNPIIIMGTNNNWKIKSSVTDIDISKIKLGDSVKVFLDAFPRKLFHGKIKQIAGSANPYSGTYDIEISLNSDGKKLVSGMIANINILPSLKQKCYLIPIQAIVNAKDNKADIFTINTDKTVAKKIKVSLNGILEDKVIIRNDGQKIDQVILDGVEYLSNNQKIKIVKK